jgi:hypothetical protein
MRTTLDIDDDVLFKAKELAAIQKQSLGSMVSQLLRERFSHVGAQEVASPKKKYQTKEGVDYIVKNGLPVLPPSNRVVTLEQIQRIRDEEGI